MWGASITSALCQRSARRVYFGKLKVLPHTVGGVATMYDPVLVLQIALMVFFTNFAHSTFLQDVGVALRELNVFFVVFAQRETCAVVTV